jgi:hypothetical protein
MPYNVHQGVGNPGVVIEGDKVMKRTLGLVILLCGGWAQAAFPERSLTLVVPFSAGGPVDAMGRTLASPDEVRAGSVGPGDQSRRHHGRMTFASIESATS